MSPHALDILLLMILAACWPSEAGVGVLNECFAAAGRQ